MTPSEALAKVARLRRGWPRGSAARFRRSGGGPDVSGDEMILVVLLEDSVVDGVPGAEP